MADDEIMIEDDAIALEDTDDTTVEDVEVSNIIPFIMERYQRAEDYRYQDEERWLRSYRNYRGLYGPDVQFTESEKSRVFIKVTKTKTVTDNIIIQGLFLNRSVKSCLMLVSCPSGGVTLSLVVKKVINRKITPTVENRIMVFSKPAAWSPSPIINTIGNSNT